ncbi:MAG: DegT/DnrJ/EryC1/StrS family aminotransferase [Cryomorphaceae bacterium]
MICRARPKYLVQEDFESAPVERPDFFASTLFFNSGRAGLKFFLEEYKMHLGKEDLNVALSSFNCDSLIQGILQSGSKAVLLDVKRSDMSISLPSLKRETATLDALILVHYQGIPNEEYEEIAAHCNANGIALIEDLSHAHGSSRNGVVLGEKAAVCLHSMAFDKPFTALYGGAVTVGNVEGSLRARLIDSFERLPVVPDDLAKKELILLRSMMHLTAPQTFLPGLDRTGAIAFFHSLGFSDARMVELYHGSSSFRAGWKLIAKLTSRLKSERITVCRQHGEKRQLIYKQFSRWQSNTGAVARLEAWMSSQGFEVPVHEGSKIEWNRYALIDPSGDLKRRLGEKGWQVGNFNWPVTLFEKYQSNPNVFVNQALNESEYVAKNVLNIPVWNTEFD